MSEKIKNKNDEKVVPIESHREVEFAPTSEMDKRDREIKYLINIIEPDPEYQPFFLSDDAYIFDATGLEEKEISRRLKTYFGQDFQFPFDAYLWKAVDEIKRQFPNWPENLKKQKGVE